VFSRKSVVQTSITLEVFLLPCSKNVGLISVNNNALLSVIYRANRGDVSSGLIRIIHRHQWPSLGAGTSCPSV